MSSPPPKLRLLFSGRIGLARVHRALGWPGMAGFASALAAGLLLWVHRPDGAPPAFDMPSPQVRGAFQAQAPVLPVLPSSRQLPLLLTQIEHAAAEQGLNWPQATYRPASASDTSPSSLELSCVLNGPYPKVRDFIANVLRRVPGAALRELTLSRATSSTPQVEAKLGFTLFLADEVALPSPLAASSASGAAP